MSLRARAGSSPESAPGRFGGRTAQFQFQFEIAFANLGLAVMGWRAASSSATARERITVGLGAGMFLWGALIGHIYQWFAHGDHQPGNTGGVLV
ncbi:DUF6790 family protein, partial [Nocardia gipuzkoensis]